MATTPSTSRFRLQCSPHDTSTSVTLTNIIDTIVAVHSIHISIGLIVISRRNRLKDAIAVCDGRRGYDIKDVGSGSTIARDVDETIWEITVILYKGYVKCTADQSKTLHFSCRFLGRFFVTYPGPPLQ